MQRSLCCLLESPTLVILSLWFWFPLSSCWGIINDWKSNPVCVIQQDAMEKAKYDLVCKRDNLYREDYQWSYISSQDSSNTFYSFWKRCWLHQVCLKRPSSYSIHNEQRRHPEDRLLMSSSVLCNNRYNNIIREACIWNVVWFQGGQTWGVYNQQVNGQISIHTLWNLLWHGIYGWVCLECYAAAS